MLVNIYRGIKPEVSYSMVTQTFQGEAWIQENHVVFSSSTPHGLRQAFHNLVDEKLAKELDYSE